MDHPHETESIGGLGPRCDVEIRTLNHPRPRSPLEVRSTVIPGYCREGVIQTHFKPLEWEPVGSGTGWVAGTRDPSGRGSGNRESAKLFSRDTRVYLTGVIRGYSGDIRRVYKGIHLLPLP